VNICIILLQGTHSGHCEFLVRGGASIFSTPDPGVHPGHQVFFVQAASGLIAFVVQVNIFVILLQGTHSGDCEFLVRVDACIFSTLHPGAHPGHQIKIWKCTLVFCSFTTAIKSEKMYFRY